MLDFTERGLNVKRKIKIYISSTRYKQTTMQSGRQTTYTVNELYDKDMY